MAGTSPSLRCQVASSAEDIEIVWSREGQENYQPSNSLREAEPGLLRHDLQFPNVQASDVGRYTCTATSMFLGRSVPSDPAFLDVFSKYIYSLCFTAQ